MDNRPHYVWSFVAIIALGMGAWIYSSNRPNTNNFDKGSNSAQTDIKHYSLVDVNPCGVLFRLDSDKPMKGKNVISTNSIAK